MFRREIICAAASAALLLSTGFAHAAGSAENSNYDPKYPFPVLKLPLRALSRIERALFQSLQRRLGKALFYAPGGT